MWQKFTEGAQSIILFAQQAASDENSRYVEPKHFLLALFENKEIAAARILAAADITQEQVQTELLPKETSTSAKLNELGDEEVEQLARESGVEQSLVRKIESALLKKLRKIQKPEEGPKLTPEAKRVLEFAADEARRLRLNYIGSEHLLLALLRQEKESPAQVLNALGLNLEAARKLVAENSNEAREN